MTSDPKTPTLRLTLNGEEHQLPGPLTVASLLGRFEIDARHTAVERNRELVPRASFAETELQDGDVLEIVTLVGGG